MRHVATVAVAVLTLLNAGASGALAATATAAPGFSTLAYTSGLPGATVLGLAFQPTTNDLYATTSNGHLVRVPFVGAAPAGAFVPGGAPVDLGHFEGTPSGIVFTPDGKLYIARTRGKPADLAAADGDGDVVEVSSTSGAVLRSLGAVKCADGLAYDPVSANLIVTTCGTNGMVKIQTPAMLNPPKLAWAGVYKAHAVSVSPSGTIFVNAPSDASTNPGTSASRDTIWQVGTAAYASSPQPVATVPGANGLALAGVIGGATPLPKFYFVDTLGGSILKVNSLLSGTTRPVAAGGDRGDFMVTGPDNCLYASMGAQVVQVTKSDGTCDLVTAGEEAPTLTLTWTAPNSSPSPRIGENVTATAVLAGVDAPAPTLSYTIAGPNAATGTATFITHSPVDRRATYSITYSGALIGPDTLSATATVGTLPIVSNTLTVIWRPLGDTTPPVVIPRVTGTAGTASFSCPANGTTPFPAPVTCGWYVTAPTVTFEIIETGSPYTASSGCDGVTVSWQPPQAGEQIICQVQSEGGTTFSTVIVQVALAEPHITASATTADGAAYIAGTPTKQNVTVTFVCDAAFQIPFMTCPGGAAVALSANPAKASYSVVVSAEGSTVLNGTVSDLPGRSASTSFAVVIDRTPPTVTGTPNVAAVNGWNNTTVTVTWSCADLVSTCTVTAPVTQTPTTDGTYVLSHTAVDVAGNVGTGGLTVKIDTVAPVITASASTSDGNPYVAGTATNLPVTVTFTCTDPGAPGAASGVATCPAPVTFTTSQASVTSGIATDLAGNPSVAATFGAIVIDTTPPTITGSGAPAPNVDGWNTGTVVVTFSCGSGAVSCTSPQSVSAEGTSTVTGTATDAAGNTATTSVIVKIDNTDPTLSITPPSGTFYPQATVQLTAADSLSGVAGIQYTLSGATTGTGTFGPAGGTLTITAIGTTTITATSTDPAGNVSDVQTATVTVSAVPLTVATTTTLTTRTLRDGRIEATAVVTQANGQFVPAGNTVTFSVGATTVTALIGANGTAIAIFPGLAPGAYTVTATFTEQPPYLASSAVASGTAAQATNFVIWGGNPGGVLIGQRVQFWGSDWSKQIADKRSTSYKAAGSFKGYAQKMTASSFAAMTGKGQREEDDDDYDEKGRKIKDVPTAEYITVAITTSVAKQGRSITGNVVGYAVVRVERTKRGSYEERAFGVVVATY